MTRPFRLGLIVNPVAGLGGPLGFHGTDGALGDRALATGAVPTAPVRAAVALSMLRGVPVEILTASGAMGADIANEASLIHDASAASTPDDTKAAARAMVAAGVDLIAFAGGDGTARDMLDAVGEAVPVLGIPAGVKLLSSVFATSPRAAGAILRDAIGRMVLTSAEVLDRAAEGAAPQLYGTMQTPAASGFQPAKASRPAGGEADLESACLRVARELRDAPLAFLGPGTTMMAVKRALGLPGTLLGVDVWRAAQPPHLDASEADLLAMPAGAALVLGVVGGQGFLLGRGNQQVSAAVMRGIDRTAITVAASAAKLAAIPGGRLLVDTGDEDMDAKLSGYLPVRVSGRQTMMMRVERA